MYNYKTTIDGFITLTYDHEEVFMIHEEGLGADINDTDAVLIELIQRYEATIY